MDYKEKYNKLVEAVKVLQEENPSDEGIQNWVNDNVPELRESEDEKVRKAIHIYLDWLDGRNKDYQPKGDYSIKDMIAWLEKQGEHADFRNKIQIGDKVTRNEDGVLVNLSQLNRVAKKDKKQGEQSHSEQDLEMVVQPKFNIGDWIISDEPYINNDYRLCKVVGIGDGCYTIQTIYGLKGYNTFKAWENDYHLCNELKKLKGE